MSVIENTNLIE